MTRPSWRRTLSYDVIGPAAFFYVTRDLEAEAAVLAVKALGRALRRSPEAAAPQRRRGLSSGVSLAGDWSPRASGHSKAPHGPAAVLDRPTLCSQHGLELGDHDLAETNRRMAAVAGMSAKPTVIGPSAIVMNSVAETPAATGKGRHCEVQFEPL